MSAKRKVPMVATDVEDAMRLHVANHPTRLHPLDLIVPRDEDEIMPETIGLPWSALAVGFGFGVQFGVAVTLALVWWRVRK